MAKSLTICGLCESKPADQKNSHIIPNVFGKKLRVYTDENGRTVSQVFNIMDYDIKGMKPPKSKQDTPKEDYILCKDCESLISTFEREFSNKVYHNLGNLRHDAKLRYFKESKGNESNAGDKPLPTIIIPNYSYKSLNKLVQSILIRAHLSETFPIKLSNGLLRLMRDNLLGNSETNLLIHMSTPLTNSRPTNNIVTILASKDSYALYCGDILFLLMLVRVDKDLDKSNLNILTDSFWASHMRDIQLFVKDLLTQP